MSPLEKGGLIVLTEGMLTLRSASLIEPDTYQSRQARLALDATSGLNQIIFLDFAQLSHLAHL